MNFNIKYKQVGTQSDSRAKDQLPDVAANCPINTTNNQVASEQIKCVSPRTFSQKLYQEHGLEIAKEFEQAIDANSLEQIKKLLDKVLDNGSDN